MGQVARIEKFLYLCPRYSPFEMNPVPAFVIFHVPHDSTVIPAYVRQQFILGDEELAAELVRMTDHLTLELLAAGVPAHQMVRAKVSRLVLDVERFEDDRLEPMSAQGMGIVYERTSAGLDLRRPITSSERQALLDAWYHPHHERLGSVTQKILDEHGRALLIDSHSFPSKPLPYEFDQRTDRPEICIGTDAFHTPKSLEVAFIDAFRNGGFDVRLNAPFSGALVPMRYYRTDGRVSAVMVEVNRALYLDESSGRRNSDFDAVGKEIRRCIQKAIHAWKTSA